MNTSITQATQNDKQISKSTKRFFTTIIYTNQNHVKFDILSK